MKKRGLKAEKFEKDKEFTRNLIDKYRKLAKMAENAEGGLPFKKIAVIDASKTIEKMHEQIKSSFNEVYEDWKNR